AQFVRTCPRGLGRADIDNGVRAARAGHPCRPAPASPPFSLRERRVRYDARAPGARLGAALARAGDAFSLRALVGDEVQRNVGRGPRRALRRASFALGVRAGADEALRGRTVLPAEGCR